MSARGRKPDPAGRFLWNFATGAALSVHPAPRTRTWRAFGTRWLGVAMTAAVAWAAVGRWRDRGLTTDATAGQIAGEYSDILAVLWAGAAAALFVAGRKATEWVCLRPHRRMWVEPIHPVLYKKCGWPWDATPAAYMHVPEDFETTGIRVRMSPEFPFTDSAKKDVEEAARNKWPLSGMETVWDQKGARRHIAFVPVQKPRLPKIAPYSDPAVAAAINGSKDGNPYLGVVAGGNAYRIDLTTETPHVLLAAGTGAGKSDAAKVLVAQLMRGGAGLIVLDLKQRSQLWCADLPGVIYCRSVPHMHRVLVALGREIRRRSEAANALGKDRAEVDLPRIILLAEEMTSTMRKLRNHWAAERARATTEERREMPLTSPAVEAYEDALLMGRAEKVNVIAIVQMGTVRSLGGPEAREQYGFRGLSRFSPNARKMLAPDSKIRSSTKPGRWVVVKGDEDSEVQIAYLTDDEAQAIATSGKRSRLTLGRVEDPRPIDLPDDGSPDLRVVRDASLVSLGEASSDNGRRVVDRTLSTLRKDRWERREEGFPKPVGKRGVEHLYDPAHLVEFYLGHSPDLARDETVIDVEPVEVGP